MAITTIPLHDLTERIQHQEAELANLRQELQTRQTHLSRLAQRKEELQAELQKIDHEIEAVTHKSTPSRTPLISAQEPKSDPSKVFGRGQNKISLSALLVSLVKEAKRPVTVKELTEEVVRNKFPTASKDLEGMVQTRVYDLMRKGMLRRLGNTSGVVLSKAATSSPTVQARASVRPDQTAAAKKPTSTKSAASPDESKKQSLHEVLTQILAKSSRPLSAQELAERVTQSGYKSKSKDLKNVIWTSVSKLASVERVAGEGYRLKKGKASGAGKKS